MKNAIIPSVASLFLLGTSLSLGVPTTVEAAVNALDGFGDLFPDETLATGKNLKVTRNELDQSYIYIKANKASQGVVIREADRPALEAQLLDKLITTKLIIQRATKAELKDGEAFREKQIGLLKEQMGSAEAMDRHIIASGVTKEFFFQQLYEEGVVKAVVEREVKGNYLVPDSEIRKTYQENQKAFTQPQSIRIRRIFIGRISPSTGEMLPPDMQEAKLKRMEGIRKRALKGEDFGELAKIFSEDPLTRLRGGEIVVMKGQTKPEFEVPVFNLKPGEVSEIMTIGAGLHLVKMVEHYPSKLRPLTEVETLIRRNLEAKYVEGKLPAYLENLKQQAGVKIVGAL